jgi:hypothetical protein
MTRYRMVMWWALKKHKVPTKYITLIREMCNNVVTSVRVGDSETDTFPIMSGLHQGSAFSPYMFSLVMNKETKDIQGDIPSCMRFAADAVLIDETRIGVNMKLGLWRKTLESKGLDI